VAPVAVARGQDVHSGVDTLAIASTHIARNRNARSATRALVVLALLVQWIVSGTGIAAEQSAGRTIADVVGLMEQFKPDPPLREQNRAKARMEPPEGLAASNLARFLHDRAWAARVIGDSRQEIADLGRALEAAPEGADRERIQHDLSTALLQAGKLSEGLRLRERLAANSPPTRQLSLSSVLTSTYREIGDWDSARAALRLAEAAYVRAAAAKNRVAVAGMPVNSLHLHRVRGDGFLMEGRFDQAEEAYRSALRYAELNVRQLEDRIEAKLMPPGQSQAIHRELTESLLEATQLKLARFLLERNRLAEAELVARDLLKSCLRRLGRDNV